MMIMSSGPVCAEVLPGCGCQGRVRDASWLRHRRPRDRPRNPGVRRQSLLPARAGGRGWTAVRLQGRRRPHSLGGHRHPGRVCDWRPSGESGRARSLCGDRSRQLHRSQSRSRGAREGLLLAGHHKRPPRRAGSGALTEFRFHLGPCPAEASAPAKDIRTVGTGASIASEACKTAI